jgi:hypothetical protein
VLKANCGCDRHHPIATEPHEEIHPQATQPIESLILDFEREVTETEVACPDLSAFSLPTTVGSYKEKTPTPQACGHEPKVQARVCSVPNGVMEAAHRRSGDLFVVESGPDTERFDKMPVLLRRLCA